MITTVKHRYIKPCNIFRKILRGNRNKKKISLWNYILVKFNKNKYYTNIDVIDK
jgi:hypothetical protein